MDQCTVQTDTGTEQSTQESSCFFRELECAEETIKLKQLYVGDVGCVVWDAAIVLCKFLENQTYFPVSSTVRGSETSTRSESFWKEKRVVDLGSGTGVVGIVAGVLGANVTVTDLPEFVELMSDNISLNKEIISGSVTAKSLKWASDVTVFLPSPDYIVMADVVYYEESLSDLLMTLLDLSDSNTTIVMSYEERTTGNKTQLEKNFFKLMAGHFMKSDVPYDSMDSVFRSRDIHVIMFRLKTV